MALLRRRTLFRDGVRKQLRVRVQRGERLLVRKNAIGLRSRRRTPQQSSAKITIAKSPIARDARYKLRPFHSASACDANVERHDDLMLSTAPDWSKASADLHPDCRPAGDRRVVMNGWRAVPAFLVALLGADAAAAQTPSSRLTRSTDCNWAAGSEHKRKRSTPASRASNSPNSGGAKRSRSSEMRVVKWRPDRCRSC